MSVTMMIVALTCAVSLVAMNNPKMIDALILWPPAVVRDKEYYRLISYGLIHADFQHLLFNMITLYFFGRVMESFYNDAMGDFGFAFFYVLGLVASILPTYLKQRNNSRYRSLGASGAVSAVLFAFILFQPWALIYVFFLPVPAIIYAVLYVGYTIYSERRGGDNINHSAHLWGAAYGIIFTLVMEPRVFSVFLDALFHPGIG
ncbi:MAG: rhomboid family intramembrane serine protease [Arenimonas sp.]|nr:rhomboid family intramembrane serine protease [Arenimonas sp.]